MKAGKRMVQVTAGVLVLVVLGNSAADVFRLLVPPAAVQAATATTAVNAAAPVAPVLNLAVLAQLPFAAANTKRESAHPVDPLLAVARQTSLGLELRGTMPSNSAAASRAIIAEGEQQNIVLPGESLPISVSGVSLVDVFKDRVLLDNNGRLETLWIDQQAAAEASTTPPEVNTLTQTLLATVPETVVELQQSLAQIASFTLHRTEQGEMGFRIKAKGDGRLFRRLGLRNDDVAVAINDVTLQDPLSALRMARSLQAGEPARLKVLRNGAPLNLELDLAILDKRYD